MTIRVIRGRPTTALGNGTDMSSDRVRCSSRLTNLWGRFVPVYALSAAVIGIWHLLFRGLDDRDGVFVLVPVAAVFLVMGTLMLRLCHVFMESDTLLVRGWTGSRRVPYERIVRVDEVAPNRLVFCEYEDEASGLRRFVYFIPGWRLREGFWTAGDGLGVLRTRIIEAKRLNE